MLSRLTGKILELVDNRVTLDVNGIGFEVFIPCCILEDLRTKGSDETVSLVIYFYILLSPTRAVPVLIGFNSDLEKEFFEEFTSVASIGPKSALKSLIYPFSVIAKAIDGGDEKLLKSMPGIGPRKVKEIIAKLQGKLAKFAAIEEGEIPPSEITPLFIPGDIKDETLEVLLQLQYNKNEAMKKIEKALRIKPDITTSQELVNLILTEGR